MFFVQIKEHKVFSHHFKELFQTFQWDINSYYCKLANMKNIEKEPYLIRWLITCFHKGALRTQHIK